MSTVIKVENLSKKYIIRHEGSEKYTALRDVITNSAKNFGSRIISPFSNQPINKKVEEFWALKDVSFEVKQGEKLGIIGRNGAGKSTLLKLLSRITEPTEGRISLKGRVSSLLEVGTGFHPELTGRENIYLNGAILGMSRDEINRKFDEIVAFAEVEKFLDTPVKRYSSGMQVRLAFAVAAQLEPEILLIDEVLAVGDASFQKKCLGKMSEIANEGRTVLFVSHNMHAIANLCNKVVYIDGGSISMFDDKSIVIDNYLNNNSKSSKGDIDLSLPGMKIRKNSLNNSLFKWTRCQIVNSAGEMTSEIRLGEPFKLIIKGLAKDSIEDLIVGFSFMSMYGFSLFNSHSIDSGIKQSYSPGEIVFEIVFKDNYLAPGQYVIDLGANGSGIVDWIPEAVTINIQDLTINGEALKRSNFYGVILYPCDWSLKQ